MSKRINYSQCWEDSRVLMGALVINAQDKVLSITSGGCNTLNILLVGPEKVTAVDFNYAQNYLLELKFYAAKILEYSDYLEFLGIKTSKQRIELFEKIEGLLSIEARTWWSAHKNLIEQGVVHVGRFENYLRFFRKYILLFLHSQTIISKLFSSKSLNDQGKFYEEYWNTKSWRIFFKLFSSRLFLNKLARQPGMFKYSKNSALGNEYLQRSARVFKSVPIRDNYFVRYCLTGGYDLAFLSPYLEYNNYLILRKINKPIIITSELLAYLKTVPDNTFSKFNLSDIFEALSIEENDSLWKEILRTAKNEAIVVYWNNLVSRSFPGSLSKNIYNDNELVDKLSKLDRVFFYKDLHINKINK